MSRTMKKRSTHDLIGATRGRYARAQWSDKGRIINELVSACGYSRKHLIRLLNETAPVAPKAAKQRRVKYDDEVKRALCTVWHAANLICSKRLVPFLPELVRNLQAHGHLQLTPGVRERLLTISPATADRLLKSERRRIGRSPSTTKAGDLLKNQIQVRTFADWDDVVPGFFEADLVAHNGGDTRGAFLNTLVMVDVSTSWLEFLPLLQKNGDYVIAGLDVAKLLIPFPLLGVDTDNGSEFINRQMIEYCHSSRITFTRGRAYRKNDQAFVEEKNGSVIRRMIGYDRYEGYDAWQVLIKLYRALRLYVNFFQPSLKLEWKHRDGAHVTRRYQTAQTPYQRVLQSDVPGRVKSQLTRQYRKLDAAGLLSEVQALQQELWGFAVPEASAVVDVKPIAPRFYRTVPKKDGRRGPHPSTRKDPFEDLRDEIEQLLEEQPNRSAAGLVRELAERYPGTYGPQHRRSMQRRLSAWRSSHDPSVLLKQIMPSNDG